VRRTNFVLVEIVDIADCARLEDDGASHRITLLPIIPRSLSGWNGQQISFGS
jgi:hypothetical protein